jgi:hypothetical protein
MTRWQTPLHVLPVLLLVVGALLGVLDMSATDGWIWDE